MRQSPLDQRRRQPQDQLQLAHMLEGCAAWKVSEACRAVKRGFLVSVTGLWRGAPANDPVRILTRCVRLRAKRDEQPGKKLLRGFVEVDASRLRAELDRDIGASQAEIEGSSGWTGL